MTNVLIVEDEPIFQDMALYGIAEAVWDEDWDIFERSTLYEIERFQIQVVSCMRDAWEYLKENTNGKLITILDGYFPPIKWWDKVQMYWKYLNRLEELRGGQENFLTPYSSSKNTNLDMIQRFSDTHKILRSEVEPQQEKSQEAIKQWFEWYLANHC